MIQTSYVIFQVLLRNGLFVCLKSNNVFVQGFGRGKDTHLSVFFKESQTLEEDVNFHFVLAVTSSTQDAFVKPMLNCVLSKSRREYTGRQAFMPLDMIQNGGYIEPDGSLLIMLEIVEFPTEAAVL
jgi:hypothetical protein